MSSTTSALTRTAAIGLDTVDATVARRRDDDGEHDDDEDASPASSVQFDAGGRRPPGTDFERNHPWSVYITGTGGLSCRGTLIHPQWVLTAGHCMGIYAGTVAYTRTDPATGTRSPTRSGSTRPVRSRGMFQHPGYVRTAASGSRRTTSC